MKKITINSKDVLDKNKMPKSNNKTQQKMLQSRREMYKIIIKTKKKMLWRLKILMNEKS